MSADTIQRLPADAAGGSYDLIVIGGGVYGIALTLESARRGLRVLLLEKDDFGAHTSWNSLRIVHGGLRYLQHMDLSRFRASVGERRWFMQAFPELVRPLHCLMPLYGEGLKRPLTFGAALRLNDLLSCKRNQGLAADAQLPGGGILTVAETAALFPDVVAEGLQGGGQWYDAHMLSSERLLVEMLRWACGAGATALNYMRVTGLETENGRVSGVRAVDADSGAEFRFQSGRVVNCAGPFCEMLGNTLDRVPEGLFKPSLAYNVLLDRPPPAEVALAVSSAVSPRRPGAAAYFLVPWKGKLLAGTRHLPCDGDPAQWQAAPPHPGAEEVARFLEDLNACVPGADYALDQVLRVQAGLLPAEAAGHADTAKHPVWVDHGRAGGVSGLYSVSGVKFTTARHVAEGTLKRIYGKQLPHPLPNATRSEASRHRERFVVGPNAGVAAFAEVAAEESALHLTDLLLRRCDWTGTVPETMHMGREVGQAMGKVLGWQGDRLEKELSALADTLRQVSADPAAPSSAGNLSLKEERV